MKINEPVPEVQEIKDSTEVKEEILSDNKDLSLQDRIAKFSDDNKSEEQISENFTFDSKEIENIEDPKAREYAEKAYKSYQKEFNKKFQQLAELRKESENSLHKEEEWTPERVQALTQDPRFLQAAQQVVPQTDNSQSDNEYSALTESEQANMNSLKNEIASLKRSQQEQQMTQFKKQQEQEHESLSNTYSNYDRQAVDTLRADLINQKVQANNGSLWKVIDYENNAKRAYELGKLDERNGTQEKVQSMSMDGGQVVQTPVNNVKPEGISSKQHWRNISSQVLRNIQSKIAIKT